MGRSLTISGSVGTRALGINLSIDDMHLGTMGRVIARDETIYQCHALKD